MDIWLVRAVRLQRHLFLLTQLPLSLFQSEFDVFNILTSLFLTVLPEYPDQYTDKHQENSDAYRDQPSQFWMFFLYLSGIHNQHILASLR